MTPKKTNNLTLDKADETVKRWWFILKWTDERLIKFYTKHLINKTSFNAIDSILNFLSENQFTDGQAQNIKLRLESITGQAILNAQNH